MTDEQMAAQGSMTDFAEAAELASKIGQVKTNGEALALILDYRHKVRLQLMGQEPSSDCKATLHAVRSRINDMIAPYSNGEYLRGINAALMNCVGVLDQAIADAAPVASAAPVVPEDQEATFEVIQDGMVVAAASGPRKDAMREAQHYAAVYGQDGPVGIREKTRRRAKK